MGGGVVVSFDRQRELGMHSDTAQSEAPTPGLPGRPHSTTKEMGGGEGDSADSRVTRYFIRFFTGAGATRRRRRALSNN